MQERSRFDRCNWRGCQASCVDEIELCWYHFRLAGETFIEKRSIFGAAALTERRKVREQEAADRVPQMSREDWWKTRSVVYYVRINDHVKVGYTVNLRERVNSLRVDRSALLAVEPGWRETEHDRHEQFAAERQGRREDFNPSRRLLGHIDVVRAKYGEPWAYTQRRVKAAGPEPVTRAAV